ncbi:MAG: DsbA family protein [Longimicrobiales bacterium]|nr:DsbA family protein [Longimicrobiales bacterium]
MSRSERRREARQEEGGSNTLFYVLGAVAVVGVGVVAYTAGATALSSAATEPVELEIGSDEELVALAQGVTMGDPSAPVTILEFGDYQCPACGAFAIQAKPPIQQQLVNTGEAKFVFYDFPLIQIHPNAFLAARAARCAGDQGAYWEYHDQLFRNQSRWSTANLPTSAYEDYAAEVGIDEEQFSDCLNSDAFADVVTANMQLGNRMSVSGTPTVFINAGGQTRRLNSYDITSIREAIESMTSGGS